MRERKEPLVHHPKQDVSDPTSPRRRALNTGLAAGLTALALPGHWTRPVVQSVLLPAHAQTSPGVAQTSPEVAVYAVEGVTAENFDFCETLTVCAVVNGDTAEVRHNPVWDSVEGLRTLSFRTGTISTDGSPGTMVAQFCMPGPDTTATITNLTENSLTYTLDRPNSNVPDIVVQLFRVGACPNFPAVDCSVECPP